MRCYNLLTILAFAAPSILAHPAANSNSQPNVPTNPSALGLSLEEFLASSSKVETDLKRRHTSSSDNNNDIITKSRRQSSNTAAGVELCTEPDFEGQCVHSVWPVNQCIDLKGYAGVTKSFLPDDGFECLLMQGQCDASDNYIEIGDSDTTVGSDLTNLEWIGDSTSYICFTEITMLQRFVRVARLRAMKTVGSH